VSERIVGLAIGAFFAVFLAVCAFGVVASLVAW
jgi:tetrahydromethanopterin S-methyltransferase subunit F